MFTKRGEELCLCLWNVWHIGTGLQGRWRPLENHKIMHVSGIWEWSLDVGLMNRSQEFLSLKWLWHWHQQKECFGPHHWKVWEKDNLQGSCNIQFLSPLLSVWFFSELSSIFSFFTLDSSRHKILLQEFQA